jgi:Ca2+-binding RTX toxin-like protein
LIGGAGADRLTGGSGKDSFVFTGPYDIGGGKASPTHDLITDFTSGQDKIDLSKVDANSLTPTTNEAFQFIGSNAFSGVPGQLHYVLDSVHHSTLVEGDLNGDKAADFQLELSGSHYLTPSDFLF